MLFITRAACLSSAHDGVAWWTPSPPITVGTAAPLQCVCGYVASRPVEALHHAVRICRCEPRAPLATGVTALPSAVFAGLGANSQFTTGALELACLTVWRTRAAGGVAQGQPSA